MISKRRPCVTLIEMLIVMAILALVGGVVAININKALDEQHFRTEVAVVVDVLRLAQELMLILQDDVHVKFSEADDRQGIKISIETESPLAESWQKDIVRSRKTLKAIHAIKFRDELIGSVRMGELDIKFLSGGTVMSRGVLRFSSTDDDTVKNALRSAICLYGYPHPINSIPETEVGAVCLPDKDTFFDTQLTENTMRTLQEKESDENS